VVNLAMKLDITEQERRALVRIITAALEDDLPLSPEIDALRAVWAKLEGGRKSKPAAMSSAHE
jgi:hypothetical protein